MWHTLVGSLKKHIGFRFWISFWSHFGHIFAFLLLLAIQICQSYHLWIAFCSRFHSPFLCLVPYPALWECFSIAPTPASKSQKILWPPSVVGWTPSLKSRLASSILACVGEFKVGGVSEKLWHCLVRFARRRTHTTYDIRFQKGHCFKRDPHAKDYGKTICLATNMALQICF